MSKKNYGRLWCNESLAAEAARLLRNKAPDTRLVLPDLPNNTWRLATAKEMFAILYSDLRESRRKAFDVQF